MALDNFQFQQTQKQNESAPQTAFGDYRGLQSVAKAADDIARYSQVLREREEKKKMASFQLENRRKVDELKGMDLSPSAFAEEYDSWFKGRIEDFDEKYRDQLTMAIYYGTIDDADFKSHIATLEDKELDEYFLESEAAVDSWVTQEAATTRKEMATLLSSFGMLDNYNSDEQKKAASERMTAQAEVVLLEADNVEEFDIMAKMAQDADNVDIDPKRMSALRTRVLNMVDDIDKEAIAALHAKISENYQNAKTIGVPSQLNDLKQLAEAGADARHLKMAAKSNVWKLFIQDNIALNNQFWEELADERTSWATLESWVGEELAGFMDGGDMQEMRNFATKMLEMEPADRLMYHEDVIHAMENGTGYQVMQTKQRLLGEGKGKPYEYYGYPPGAVARKLIDTNMLKKIHEIAGANYSSPDAYQQAVDAMWRGYGQYAELAKTAYADALMTGDIPGIEKNPKLQAFYGFNSFWNEDGIQLSWDAMQSKKSDSYYLSQLHKGKYKNELQMRTDILNKLMEKDPQFNAFYEYLSSKGQEAQWESYESLFVDMVNMRAQNLGGSIDEAVSDVRSLLKTKMMYVEPEGARGGLLIDKEAYSYQRGVDILKESMPGPDGMFGKSSFTVLFGMPWTMVGTTWNWLTTDEDDLEELSNRALSDNIAGGFDLPEEDITRQSENFEVDGNFITTPGQSVMKGALWFGDMTIGRLVRMARGYDKKPTFLDPEKYQIGDEPNTSAREMRNRMLVPEGPLGAFRTEPIYRLEPAVKDGQSGFHVYTLSKDYEGNNPDAVDNAALNTPFRDRKTKEIAFFPLSMFQ